MFRKKRRVFNTGYIRAFLIKYRDSLAPQDNLRGDLNRLINRLTRKELGPKMTGVKEFPETAQLRALLKTLDADTIEKIKIKLIEKRGRGEKRATITKGVTLSVYTGCKLVNKELEDRGILIGKKEWRRRGYCR